MIEKTIPQRKYKTEKVRVIEDNTCNRCLGKNIGYDSKNRAFCLECHSYGNLSEERYLYRYERAIPKIKHVMEVEYELTDLQKLGSDFLMECYENKESGFLQAVCGAGKTEMTYELILKALNENKKVCFVLPRVQVLKQVQRRFFKHFPKTIVRPLYEGYKDANKANLVISTPQQLISFHNEFDLMFIDEMDAFPLNGNKFLERLIQKSIKNSGTILYMSATITKNFQTKIDKDKIRCYLIPERFHKSNLPVPKFVKYRDVKNNLFLHKFIDRHLHENKQFLLFAPSIKKVEAYYNYYKSKYKCNYLTSHTKYKNEIIKDFQNGNYLFLITTTILERGVTFKNIDVLVLESDSEVFNKETLIQISGRVGRSIINPYGEIYFLSRYMTKAMVESKNEIMKMNELKNEM